MHLFPKEEERLPLTLQEGFVKIKDKIKAKINIRIYFCRHFCWLFFMLIALMFLLLLPASQKLSR